MSEYTVHSSSSFTRATVGCTAAGIPKGVAESVVEAPNIVAFAPENAVDDGLVVEVEGAPKKEEAVVDVVATGATAPNELDARNVGVDVGRENADDMVVAEEDAAGTENFEVEEVDEGAPTADEADDVEVPNPCVVPNADDVDALEAPNPDEVALNADEADNVEAPKPDDADGPPKDGIESVRLPDPNDGPELVTLLEPNDSPPVPALPKVGAGVVAANEEVPKAAVTAVEEVVLVVVMVVVTAAAKDKAELPKGLEEVAVAAGVKAASKVAVSEDVPKAEVPKPFLLVLEMETAEGAPNGDVPNGAVGETMLSEGGAAMAMVGISAAFAAFTPFRLCNSML
jgi:hypothetical protein